MDWWKPLAALAVASLAFVAVGSLVRLARTVLGSTAALAVLGVVLVAVFAMSRWGESPNRWLSNPYWGR